MQPNHLNIYTDGSSSDKSSSWGFLANFPKEPVMKMGLLPKFFKTASAAEAISIVKALSYLIETNKQNMTVKIFTDCQSLTHVVRRKVRNGPDKCQITVALKKEIRNLVIYLRKQKVFVKLVFVKSHTLEQANEKTLCNRIVDISVRRIMRKKRETELKRERKLSYRLKGLLYRNFLEKTETDFWIAHGGWTIDNGISVNSKDIKEMNRQAQLDVFHNQKHKHKQRQKAAA